MNINNIMGVVLCGGESKRMGRDKGLIPVQSSTWAQATAEKLKSLGIEVTISINQTQLGCYSKFFSNNSLITDKVNIPGPLAGILSVHEQYPFKDLLVIACDMIQMRKGVLDHLLSSYKDFPAFDFYVYKSEKFIEPFPAIYSAECLSYITKKVNILQSFSMRNLIENSNFKIVDIADKKSFENFNTLA